MLLSPAGVNSYKSSCKQSGSRMMKNRNPKRNNVESLPSISKSIELENDGRSEKEHRRPKKRKKTPKQELQPKSSIEQDTELIRQMELVQDDIVTISSITPQKCAAVDAQMNELSNGVYLQLPGGFKEIKKSDLHDLTDFCEPYVRQKFGMKSDLSIAVQRLSHRVVSLAHGLLAGISLWECLMVHFVRPPAFSHSDFALHFSPIAEISQILFYVLLVVCLLDSLDRGDLIGIKSNFLHHFFIIGSSSVVTLLYFISLILTVYISNVETKYSEYSSPNITNSTEWRVTLGEHNAWWDVIVARCIVLCTSWVVLNLWPSESRLLEHLEKMKELELIKDDSKISMAL